MGRKERRKQERIDRKSNKKKTTKTGKEEVDFGGGFILAKGNTSPLPPFVGSNVFLLNNAIYCVASIPNVHKEDIKQWESKNWSFGLNRVQGQAGIYAVVGSLMNEFFINLNLQSVEEQKTFLSPMGDNESFMFIFCLVDNLTNKIATFRMFGLSKDFNQELQNIFIEQTAQNLQAVIDERKLPTVQEAFSQCFIKEKSGGQVYYKRVS